MDAMQDGNNKLMQFYDAMLARYGRQKWWPGESGFEVMVGAVLTQNTNWSNVEKAIANLKSANVLDAHTLDELGQEELAELIRPAGYFNRKARRLKNLVGWFCREYDGCIDLLASCSVGRLREELLSVSGVGPETADSIILYALEKATFVVDTYTHRILVRHGCVAGESDYEELKYYCESHLPEEVELYNELHALIVAVGKNHCKPRPRCEGCPLVEFEHEVEV